MITFSELVRSPDIPELLIVYSVILSQSYTEELEYTILVIKIMKGGLYFQLGKNTN
jgi:hypothetical protein